VNGNPNGFKIQHQYCKVCIFIIYLRYTANITRKNKNFATYNQLKVSGNTYARELCANSSSNIEKTGSRSDK